MAETLSNFLVKISAFLLSAAALTTIAAADTGGFRNEKELISPALTPYDNKYTSIQWNTEPADKIGVPVAFAESVLIPSGNTIIRLNEADGTKMAQIELPAAVCTSYSGTMRGTVLYQPLENGICAVDFTTGTVTATRLFDGNIDSDVSYIDNKLYFSVTNGGLETFYCTNAENDFETIYEYPSDANITSATIQGEYIIFGAGNKLVTHHYRDGGFIEIPVENDITSTPFASQYAVFFTDSAGYACKLRLNSDGTMEDDTLVRCEVGENSSAPLAYNNKLYLSSENGFQVLDSINMEITHTIPTIKNGSDPFICYGNGIRVYCVGNNEGRWELHSIFDMSEDKAPTDEILAIMENYENGRSDVSENGTLYFRDSYGRVYALTRVDYDIISIVIKLLILIALMAGVFIWIRMIGKRRNAINPRY